MPDIVITEFMDERAVEDLRRDFAVLYDPQLFRRPDELRETLTEARALIVRNQTQVRGALLENAPALKVVGRLGVGLDNIDLGACADREVTVMPAIGANDAAVAEYVLAGLLMLFRGAYAATSEVLAGKWPRNALIGGEIMGRTLGLVGFGGIAREVARRAGAFRMRVLAHDPAIDADSPLWEDHEVRPRSLEDLLAEADAVSLHVPLTKATRNLIDAKALAAMKPGAILINSARGGVVDEAALAAALKDGRLGGAMLDVFASEPLPAGSPLDGAPNLILTPHIAGVTRESNARVSAVTAANVRRVLEATR